MVITNSKDMNHAIELWQEGWTIKRVAGRYIFFEVYLAKEAKHIDVEAPTLALALNRAYLTEEMKEEK